MVEQAAQWRPAQGDGAPGEVNDAPRPFVISEQVRQMIEKATPRAVDPTVTGLLDSDARARTPQSFDTAVTGVAEATRKNYPYLQLKLSDQMNSTGETDTIQRYRQVAILSAAMGENMLYEGTRFDMQLKTPPIKFAKDLDLGGHATSFFRTAAGNLLEAERYAEAHQGETINGRKVSDLDVAVLKASREAIEARLETIYGDHQILGKDGAFAKFRATLDTDPEAATKFVIRLQRASDMSNPADTAYQGKLARDHALCLLAATDQKMDKGDGRSAAVLFTQAKQYLEAAQKIDPAHAPGDIKSLTMIVEQLKLRGLK